jgi:hypothetical protein
MKLEMMTKVKKEGWNGGTNSPFIATTAPPKKKSKTFPLRFGIF